MLRHLIRLPVSKHHISRFAPIAPKIVPIRTMATGKKDNAELRASKLFDVSGFSAVVTGGGTGIGLMISAQSNSFNINQEWTDNIKLSSGIGVQRSKGVYHWTAYRSTWSGGKALQHQSGKHNCVRYSNLTELSVLRFKGFRKFFHVGENIPTDIVKWRY